ncbi:hypothetical protein F8M41_014061 [Gigaspora margarita]|uniref:Uncharacterized protein n=1 Tax=Gigaspora margarita TaxID=4874 RepID=A0A8H4ARX7_GIGMA|nr:hypothetical protein F8M41_014061 [Gigaspora margarita]
MVNIIKHAKNVKNVEITKSKYNKLDYQDNFEVLSGEGFASSASSVVTNKTSEPERSHAEVDYLDLENLIEHEIQELATDVQIDKVADVAYQNHLTVNLDNTIFQDRTAKGIANLVVAKIKDGDDYSLKKASSL